MAARRLANHKMVHGRRLDARLHGWCLEPSWRKHHIGKRNGDHRLVWRLDVDDCSWTGWSCIRIDLGVGIPGAGTGRAAMSGNCSS